MREITPFQTVQKLAKECGARWKGYEAAVDATLRAEKKLRRALLSGNPNGRLLDYDSSLILCGSFARYEMTDDSDYDWSLLVDGVVNEDHAAQANQISDALDTAKLEQPGRTGTFGNLVFSHDLVHRIGGGPDSNENLTRRMLMLLESRPFKLTSDSGAEHVWNNVVSNILQRYFEQDVHFSPAHERRVPRFLLNDVTRYWRTICVDYAAKHRERGGEEWAIRNAKLRLSRKLLFASGLAFCLSCQLCPPTTKVTGRVPISPGRTLPYIQSAMEFARTPSIEFLAQFVDRCVKDGRRRKRVASQVFGSYNQWLILMGDTRNRKHLASLSHEEAKRDKTFQRIRRIGKDFASGLRLLFFNRDHDDDPIANLCLDYVGF
jgi:hypothetical protein